MVTDLRFPPPTLDPDEAVEEVGAAPRVGSRAPVGPADLVGSGGEAGVLPDLVGQVGRERAITVGVEDDTWGREGGVRPPAQRVHTGLPWQQWD